MTVCIIHYLLTFTIHDVFISERLMDRERQRRYRERIRSDPVKQSDDEKERRRYEAVAQVHIGVLLSHWIDDDTLTKVK